METQTGYDSIQLGRCAVTWEGTKAEVVEDRKTCEVASLSLNADALQTMQRIEVSFNCAVCGQRMDELTEDGICVVCKEALTSSANRQ